MANYKIDGSFSFEETLSNGNFIVSYKSNKAYIDEKGNIQNKRVKK